MDENLRCINAKRSSYDNAVGDKILKKQHEWSKLGERWDDPYTITHVHVNSNMTVQLHGGAMERLNIRRIKPYHKPTLPSSANPVLPVQPAGYQHCSRIQAES